MPAIQPTHAGKDHTAIAQLSLPTRARNALIRAGIVTLEQASEWSERELLSLPHFGRASVASLRAHIGNRMKSSFAHQMK